jgi:hypothetical protein
LGDSITDGYNATGPPGQRWTDVLAERLDALPASARLSVANAGISGNTVSVQPNPYDPTGQCCGPPTCATTATTRTRPATNCWANTLR